MPVGGARGRSGFDVLIIGAGSAGCVLAGRLSEDPARSVGLVEAGPVVGTVGVPGPADALDSEDLGSIAHRDAERWFSYDARAWEGGPAVPVVRGRRVGGSGAVNGAFFLRGLPEDYDAWGSPLWTWAQVLPFLRRIEADSDFGGEVHGRDGPVPVQRDPPTRWRPFHHAFWEAALAAGFAEKPDLNHPDGSGIGPFPRNGRGGHRVGADAAYLAPALGRPNLTLLADTPVARVTVRRGRATGVELRDGEAIPAGEVILCAGALETPRLLMLSGIGPASQLRAARIGVVADLPGVGANLRDHPAVVVTGHDRGPPGTGGRRHQVVLAYTAPGSPDRNDMQMAPTHAVGDAPALRIVCSLQLPLSAGRLRLRRDATPTVELGYLQDAWDRRRLLDAARLASELLGSHADPPSEAWLERSIFTLHHGCGTCRMGPASDPDAVADDHGRVHGIESLRIADLSLAPTIVRANPNATALLIGERVAALAKG